MGDWFRQTTWGEKERAEFDARLRRSRGGGSKAQYLRVQAWHLAEVGEHAGALELLDRLFAGHADQALELATAHWQMAESLAKLGRVEAAVAEYRRSLQAEREFPNVRTNAWLDFGWLVVERELSDLYEEVDRVFREFFPKERLTFPAEAYRYAAVRALLAEAGGESAGARDFARRALREAERTHSGYRYHAKAGLVESERETFAARLRRLAEG